MSEERLRDLLEEVTKEYTSSLADVAFGEMDQTSAEWLAMDLWWAGGFSSYKDGYR